jgi:hypothetical protein
MFTHYQYMVSSIHLPFCNQEAASDFGSESDQ